MLWKCENRMLYHHADLYILIGSLEGEALQDFLSAQILSETNLTQPNFSILY